MSKSGQSPFPGMNPYLEDVNRWRGFHNALASEVVVQLNAQITPAYYAELEVHTVMEVLMTSQTARGFPDVGVYEADIDSDFVRPETAVITPVSERRVALAGVPTKLLNVRVTLLETQELVTTIELLSPANKQGKGLEDYREKRERILRSDVHLVEIDLLRRGQRPALELANSDAEAEYVILVNRAESTERVSDIWWIALNQPLPTIPVPLRNFDPDAVLDLNQIVQTVMERFRYYVILDYTRPIPSPKLRPEMAAWWEQRRSELLSQ